MTQITYSETLTVTSCWCGVNVAIPENLYNWMQRSSKNNCYCPIGHQFHFTNTLREEREEMEKKVAAAERKARATRELLTHEERSHAATRGHLTRVKNRVHHGVCPHCNRSFQDLRRHMRSKHKAELKQEES